MWESHSENNQWGWVAQYITDHCEPSDLDGVQIESAPYDGANDYTFTVKCRIDRAGAGARYFVEMEHAGNDETALEVEARLRVKLGRPVKIAGYPYYSSVANGKFFWFVYALKNN